MKRRPGRDLLDRQVLEAIGLLEGLDLLARRRLEHERLGRELLVEDDLRHLDDTERRALVDRLCAKQDATLGVDLERDRVRAEPQAVHVRALFARRRVDAEGGAAGNGTGTGRSKVESGDEPDCLQ